MCSARIDSPQLQNNVNHHYIEKKLSNISNNYEVVFLTKLLNPLNQQKNDKNSPVYILSILVLAKISIIQKGRPNFHDSRYSQVCYCILLSHITLKNRYFPR